MRLLTLILAITILNQFINGMTVANFNGSSDCHWPNHNAGKKYNYPFQAGCFVGDELTKKFIRKD